MVDNVVIFGDVIVNHTCFLFFMFFDDLFCISTLIIQFGANKTHAFRILFRVDFETCCPFEWRLK